MYIIFSALGGNGNIVLPKTTDIDPLPGTVYNIYTNVYIYIYTNVYRRGLGRESKKLGHQNCHALHFMAPSRYTCRHCSASIYNIHIQHQPRSMYIIFIFFSPADNKSCSHFNRCSKNNSTSISWFFVCTYILVYSILRIVYIKWKTNINETYAQITIRHRSLITYIDVVIKHANRGCVLAIG